MYWTTSDLKKAGLVISTDENGTLVPTPRDIRKRTKAWRAWFRRVYEHRKPLQSPAWVKEFNAIRNTF